MDRIKEEPQALPYRRPHRLIDPRLYQISILSGLLLHGIVSLQFDITFFQILSFIGVALLTQYVCSKQWQLPRFDPRSPLISALSLLLLIRSDHIVFSISAIGIAISSKFLLRCKGKHIFNPTNIGITALMLLTDGVWVSPGQWGNAAFFGFLLACLGGLVINRSSRSDVTYAFLGFYLTILFGRSFWLGEPMAIPLHRLQNGGFLLFAFFMISDPKTTPDSRLGRVLFALLVALGAGYIHFVLYRPNGLLWSLTLFSMAGPLIDSVFTGTRYQWQGFSPMKDKKQPSNYKGEQYETIIDDGIHSPSKPKSFGRRPCVLRILCGQGRHQAVQQGLTGRHRTAR